VRSEVGKSKVQGNLPPTVIQLFKKFKLIINKISMLFREMNLDGNWDEQFDVTWDTSLESLFGTGKF
jgi:hypothetical protein